MGEVVTNMNLNGHRADGIDPDLGNDYRFHDHYGNGNIDADSPLFPNATGSGIKADLTRTAQDGQKTQSDFDAVAGAIGNGVGSWYQGRSAAFKRSARAFFQHEPPVQ